MSPSSLSAVLLLLTVYRLSEAFPVPPSHRFTVYTPYWNQDPRSLPAVDRVDCLVNLCKDNLPYLRTPGKRSKNVYKSGVYCDDLFHYIPSRNVGLQTVFSHTLYLGQPSKSLCRYCQSAATSGPPITSKSLLLFHFLLPPW